MACPGGDSAIIILALEREYCIVVFGYKLVYALCLSPLRNIPGPFFARLSNIRLGYIGMSGKMSKYAMHDYEKYGDLYVCGPNAVSLSNLADLKSALSTHAFAKPEFYHAFHLFGIENILSSSNADLVGIRKRQVGPFFNLGYLQNMEPTILKAGYQALKEKWDAQIEAEAKGNIEINYSMSYMLTTLDVIGALMCGQELECIKTDNVVPIKWVQDSMMLHMHKAVFPILKAFPFSLLVRGLEDSFGRATRAVRRLINRRRAILESGAEKPVDLLQAFLDAEDPHSKIRMSETEIQVESMLMLGAGIDTTANTLAWTTHLLMLHPDIYRRAVDEIRSQFDSDHLITYADAREKLPFTEACIYESLRLCPVIGGQLPRSVPSGGVTFQGHYLPGGTELHINFRGAAMNKDMWPEPYKYNPDRFVGNSEARRNFFAFSSGVRVCTGRNLSWMEMLTIFANMLKDYDWSLPDDYTHLGPKVLDERGYPKKMESRHFIITASANPERDCRLVIKKHVE
ncbi:cytochrome P450 [Linderina pennispora]|uniref:Cytochrome P450 n=1 Tax=Linderina pennispora TaxID=61395 RepID=A0A1Y1VV16_9FUNG|nr:cytochrome P450 [Linderina pennispora]ORX64855.1 cytochrome P450 [Linderina pennispora]